MDLKRVLEGWKKKPEVLALHAHDLEGVFTDLKEVAQAAGVDHRALEEKYRARLERVRKKTDGVKKRKVFCIEWFEPVYSSGHWVPEMVEIAGGKDPIAQKGKDSVRVSWPQVVKSRPDKLILMACGFTMARARRELPVLTCRPEWAQLPAVQAGEVYLADGPSYFNGGGLRLVDGVEILSEMIHPEIFPRKHRRGYAKIGDTDGQKNVERRR